MTIEEFFHCNKNRNRQEWLAILRARLGMDVKEMLEGLDQTKVVLPAIDPSDNAPAWQHTLETPQGRETRPMDTMRIPTGNL